MTGGGDRSGSELGPYRLTRLIGRGGMGEVYEAVDTRKGRSVALKLLPEHLAHDDDFRARFLRESRAVARLNSPHVIPIHDFGEIDGQLFLDMRYVDGDDFRELLSTGRVTRDRAVSVVAQIAEALDSAHAAGLVHRDVKPENILVDSSGFAYLADFGLVRVAGETSLTATGAPIGSFNYMAPERFRNGQDVGSESDVYALACVLYESISGQRPFGSGSLEQIVVGHLQDELPSTGTDFDPVIAAGSAKDPTERYPGAGELARDVQRVLAGEGPTGPRTRVADQLTVMTLAPSSGRLPSEDLEKTIFPGDSGASRPSRSPVLRTGIAVVVVAVLAIVGYGVYRLTVQEPVRDTEMVAALSTSTTATTAMSTSTSVEKLQGDLGIQGRKMSTESCDGRGAILVKFNSDTGVPELAQSEIAGAFENYRGTENYQNLRYMRTDQFLIDGGSRLGPCRSIRDVSNGNLIYIVYQHFPTVEQACAAEPPDDSYVRKLDQNTPDNIDPC
ncbi:MAG: serine/threonine-protein kinase [Gordonia sp. (in: high G+C Gram-positive bacteria)]|uniref:serine/threonine-protein kinase n=1 Tax=Gordonia sp. (in: high G+C Gram-positive bacteria) TaxID=84139 RepID=UPI0039E70FE8